LQANQPAAPVKTKARGNAATAMSARKTTEHRENRTEDTIQAITDKRSWIIMESSIAKNGHNDYNAADDKNDESGTSGI
jgi:hypothetical protein